MNDETRDLLHQLEQATSREAVDRGSLDEETAMLRENWLAFGRLLQSSDQSRLAETISLRPPTASPRRSGLWILASVASAIAASFILWISWPAIFPNNHQGVVQQPDQVHPEPGLPASGVYRGMREVAWEDDWDHNFYQTSLALQQFHDEQRRRDSSLSQLQSEFLEFAREVESESL